jgi:hypothetical protein
LGKYVYGDEASEMSVGGGNMSIVDPQAGDEPDGDLPF